MKLNRWVRNGFPGGFFSTSIASKILYILMCWGGAVAFLQTKSSTSFTGKIINLLCSLLFTHGFINLVLGVGRDSISIFINLIEIFRIIVRRNYAQVKSAPGSKILPIVEFLYSPKIVEETFKPTIADWRIEYFEALKQDRALKAKWISLRYYWYFFKMVGQIKIYSVIKLLIGLFIPTRK